MTSVEPRRPDLLAELGELRRRLEVLERMPRGYSWDPATGVLDAMSALRPEIARFTGAGTLNASQAPNTFPFGVAIESNVAAAQGWPLSTGERGSVLVLGGIDAVGQWLSGEGTYGFRSGDVSSNTWGPWQGITLGWSPKYYGSGASLNQSNWSTAQAWYCLRGDWLDWQLDVEMVSTAGSTDVWGFDLPYTPLGTAHTSLGYGLRRVGSARQPMHVYQDGNSDRTFVYFSDTPNSPLSATMQNVGDWMMFRGAYRWR